MVIATNSQSVVLHNQELAAGMLGRLSTRERERGSGKVVPAYEKRGLLPLQNPQATTLSPVRRSYDHLKPNAIDTASISKEAKHMDVEPHSPAIALGPSVSLTSTLSIVG